MNKNKLSDETKNKLSDEAKTTPWGPWGNTQVYGLAKAYGDANVYDDAMDMRQVLSDGLNDLSSQDNIQL